MLETKDGPPLSTQVHVNCRDELTVGDTDVATVPARSVRYTTFDDVIGVAGWTAAAMGVS